MNKNLDKMFLAVILFFSSLLFFKTPGTDDVDAWLLLVRTLNDYGLVEGYAALIDRFAHPPGMGLILYISVAISNFLGLSAFIGIKLSVYFFLLLTIIVLYVITRNYILCIISYFLLMIASLGLMYLDIYYTPFLILSLYYLKRRNILLTSIFYFLAAMIKMQVIILLPFIVLQIFNINSLSGLKRLDYKKITLNFIVPFILIYSIIISIYGMPFLLSFKAGFKHDLISALAINLGWIVTFFLHLFSPDKYGSIGSTNYNISMIRDANIWFHILKYIFFISYTIIFLKYFKQKEKSFEKFLLYATAAFLSYFILNKGVHENHLYVAIILLIFLYGEDKKYFVDMFMWGILFNINMILFYSFDGTGLWDPIRHRLGIGSGFYRVIKYLDLSLLFSIVSVVTYVYFIFKYVFKQNDQSTQNKRLSEGF